MATQIQIEIDTKDRLLDWGKKSETYDDLLNRMLDELLEHQTNKRVIT